MNTNNRPVLNKRNSEILKRKECLELLFGLESQTDPSKVCIRTDYYAKKPQTLTRSEIPVSERVKYFNDKDIESDKPKKPEPFKKNKTNPFDVEAKPSQSVQVNRGPYKAVKLSLVDGTTRTVKMFDDQYESPKSFEDQYED